MGYSRTWTYSLDVSVVGEVCPSRREWRTASSRMHGRGHGRPTRSNIAKWVARYEASRRPGGVNAHCGPCRVTAAHILDQRSGMIVATWPSPSVPPKETADGCLPTRRGCRPRRRP